MLTRRSVAIIGTGQVGMAAAYAIFQQRAVSEIILVDQDKDRAAGEAMDLIQGQSYVGRCQVRAGDYADLDQSQVILISAGVGQKPGETRLDLLRRNRIIFQEIISRLDHYAPEAILLVATNPVDILTHISQQLSRRPPGRIIGTGTMLDTTRFRTLLGEYYNTDPRSVHAVILGEHGDSEVPIWSTADIAGTPILNNTVLGKPFDPDIMESIFQRVRRAAYAIIERKGYTNWAIGLVLAHLVRTIVSDQNSILPVSVRLQGEYGIENVCLSIPACVGISGLGERVPPTLADTELDALRHSATVLRQSLDSLGDA